MVLRVLLRNFIDSCFDFLTFIAFKYSIKKCESFNEVVIFDLDNTLCNTYPLLNSMSLRSVYRYVQVHPPMIKLLDDFYKNEVYLFILSSRKVKYWGTTKKYIRQNISKSVPFYLVSEPHEKIKFIKYCSGRFDKVILFDDLSYNHENGEVKFYNEVIDAIRKMPVSYFDFDDICRINNCNR